MNTLRVNIIINNTNSLITCESDIHIINISSNSSECYYDNISKLKIFSKFINGGISPIIHINDNMECEIPTLFDCIVCIKSKIECGSNSYSYTFSDNPKYYLYVSNLSNKNVTFV